MSFKTALTSEQKSMHDSIDDSQTGINLMIKQTSIAENPVKTLDFRGLFPRRITATPEEKEEISSPPRSSNWHKRKEELEKVPFNEEASQSKRHKPDIDDDSKIDMDAYRILNWGADSDDSKSVPAVVSLKTLTRKRKENRAAIDSEKAFKVLEEDTSLFCVGQNPLYKTKTKESLQGIIKGFHPKESLTPDRVSSRQKQIDLGKQTQGYKNYRMLFPKPEENESCEIVDDDTQQAEEWMINRLKESLVKKKKKTEDSVELYPTTPKKAENASKRQWDVKVRKWRRSLHLYDTVTSMQDFEVMKAKHYS